MLAVIDFCFGIFWYFEDATEKLLEDRLYEFSSYAVNFENVFKDICTTFYTGI